MHYGHTPGSGAMTAVADAQHRVFWLESAERPAAQPELLGAVSTDLLVVGGGFTGLWTAVLAKQADPGRDVVLVEGGRVADGASGRNGGFVAASLTHGVRNGIERWPAEMPTLVELGRRNLDEIEAFVRDRGIDCDFVRTGELDVAVEPHQVAEVEETVTLGQSVGEDFRLLEGAQVRARVDSPLYLAGLHDPTGVALVDPARLAWGLREACLEAGVRVFERTPVRGIVGRRDHVTASVRRGVVRAERVALATNAYPPLLRRLGRYVVPVYDYVLMTEPLTDAQWSAIGWQGREGVSDVGNQFHYYRTTSDGRILWGGYDAVYHPGSGFGPQFEHSRPSYERLAEHFLRTFPQLAGIRFSHAWGGAIDTCSRFAPFWGRAHGGRTAYVAGYTGLGVGASRFGAQVMLDLLDDADTERTRLDLVRSRPLPFPPEPVRSWGIGLTTASLRSADENGGRRNLWLRTLDAVGLGFDS